MHRGTITEFEFVKARLAAAGVPTQKPGFFDHPNFLAQEQVSPEYLENYHRFVRSVPLDDLYTDRAKVLVPEIARGVAAYFASQNKLGACQLASMALSRALDDVGVWNCCMQGAFSARLAGVPESARTFHAFQAEATATGTVYGHAWVYAPPYYVVDVSARLQAWDINALAAVIPPAVSIEHPVLQAPDASVLLDPSFKSADLTLLYQNFPLVRDFIADFPRVNHQVNGIELCYHATCAGAPDAGIEQLGVDVPGMKFFQFWQMQLKPSLQYCT